MQTLNRTPCDLGLDHNITRVSVGARVTSGVRIRVTVVLELGLAFKGTINYNPDWHKDNAIGNNLTN